MRDIAGYAESFVREQWRAVERIAQALMENGTIGGGAELDALIGGGAVERAA